MAKIKSLFISSIQQNAGKTTVSLGLYKIFLEKKLKPAFIKPVGQQTVSCRGEDIDKDTYLIGSVYHCKDKLKDMSPVTIGAGYTEEYIYSPVKNELQGRVKNAYDRLVKGKESVIIEGTGHAGVGAVIDASNADVAKILGAKVIIVAGGGIGRSIDEIVLNKALFDLQKVEVLGVIINKVLPEKFARVKKALAKGLKHKGIRLLGTIPWDPFMSAPTIGQLVSQLGLQVMCGKTSMNLLVRNVIVAAMEPDNMVNYISDGTLVLTSGDRVDNIMVAVSAHLVTKGKKTQVSGIVLSGGLMPNVKIMDLLKKSRIPILVSEEDTYTMAGQIDNLICKIQKTDTEKISEARQLVREHVDVEQILKNL